MSESIASRYQRIFDEVHTLASRRAWKRDNLKLIVVTKKQKIDACLEVIAAGATDFGENYAEEAAEKFININNGKLNFHLIGHLQSRKIRLLFPLFSTLQTLDSLEISEKVNRYYAEKKAKINALIEINLTEEMNKSGFTINNVFEIEQFYYHFEKMIKLPNIQINGLMTMGYYPENEETNRLIFRRTKEIQEKLKEKYNLEGFEELSMGTSGDYQTAIQEGSTMVRIGEKIMGPRDYAEKK